MIEVQGLTKRYGPHLAVDDVSFKVARGEIVGFLGPNGAGKTTTLRMLTGFLVPTAGSILVDGQDALRTDVRDKIGYMSEGVPLHHDMRVLEYLKFRADLKGVGRSKRSQYIERSLEQAAITDVRHRIIGQLSKGYRQRVGLADALLADPPLLVLDEPTAGLDPNQIRQVRELIRSLGGDKTIFVSTHILPEVEATCDRVVIIRKGKKVGEGDPATLRGNTTDRQTLRVAVRAALASLEKAVESVQQASWIDGEQKGERAVGRLKVNGGDDALAAISKSITDAGLVLLELTIEAVSLEDVFTQLTLDEEPVTS